MERKLKYSNYLLEAKSLEAREEAHLSSPLKNASFIHKQLEIWDSG